MNKAIFVLNGPKPHACGIPAYGNANGLGVADAGYGHGSDRRDRREFRHVSMIAPAAQGMNLRRAGAPIVSALHASKNSTQ